MSRSVPSHRWQTLAVLLVAALMACGGDDGTGPPVATQLAFTVQPTDATAGASIALAVVAIQDASGNVVTTATNAVTIAIGTNPAGATLSGTATVSAVNGVASFSDLTIDKAASGYTLAASATGLTSATSAGFSITLAPLVFRGTIVGAGEIGVIDLTVASPLTGTLTILGGPVINLTGDYNRETGQLTASGGGYSLMGTFANGTLSGTYTGPNGSGAMVALPPEQGTVQVFCGTFMGTEDDAGGLISGTWQLVRSGNTLEGVAVENGSGEQTQLTGTISGTDIFLTYPGGSASGILSGESISGTWMDDPPSMDSGTWMGSTGACTESPLIFGTYTLQTVNGTNLPVVVFEDVNVKVELTAGSLQLNGDHTFSSSFTVRTTVTDAAGNVTVTTQTDTGTGTFTVIGPTFTVTDSNGVITVGSIFGNTITFVSEDGFTVVFTK